VECLGAGVDFFPAGLIIFGEDGFAGGFDCVADSSRDGLVSRAVVSVAACFSGTGVVATGAAASCGIMNAAEAALNGSTHTPARTITRQHLKPDGNTFFNFRAETRTPEPDFTVPGKTARKNLNACPTRSFPIWKTAEEAWAATSAARSHDASSAA
jgi:hypothetical protein